MFFEHFVFLCNQKGVTPTRAIIEAGINKSAVTYWRKNPNSRPTGQNALKLCHYFGISMSDLYGEEELENPTTKEKKELNQQKELLLQYTDKLTSEQLDLLLAQIRLMLEQKQERLAVTHQPSGEM